MGNCCSSGGAADVQETVPNEPDKASNRALLPAVADKNDKTPDKIDLPSQRDDHNTARSTAISDRNYNPPSARGAVAVAHVVELDPEDERTDEGPQIMPINSTASTDDWSDSEANDKTQRSEEYREHRSSKAIMMDALDKPERRKSGDLTDLLALPEGGTEHVLSKEPPRQKQTALSPEDPRARGRSPSPQPSPTFDHERIGRETKASKLKERERKEKEQEEAEALLQRRAEDTEERAKWEETKSLLNDAHVFKARSAMNLSGNPSAEQLHNVELELERELGLMQDQVKLAENDSDKFTHLVSFFNLKQTQAIDVTKVMSSQKNVQKILDTAKVPQKVEELSKWSITKELPGANLPNVKSIAASLTPEKEEYVSKRGHRANQLSVSGPFLSVLERDIIANMRKYSGGSEFITTAQIQQLLTDAGEKSAEMVSDMIEDLSHLQQLGDCWDIVGLAKYLAETPKALDSFTLEQRDIADYICSFSSSEHWASERELKTMWCSSGELNEREVDDLFGMFDRCATRTDIFRTDVHGRYSIHDLASIFSLPELNAQYKEAAQELEVIERTVLWHAVAPIIRSEASWGRCWGS